MRGGFAAAGMGRESGGLRRGDRARGALEATWVSLRRGAARPASGCGGQGSARAPCVCAASGFRVSARVAASHRVARTGVSLHPESTSGRSKLSGSAATAASRNAATRVCDFRNVWRGPSGRRGLQGGGGGGSDAPAATRCPSHRTASSVHAARGVLRTLWRRAAPSDAVTGLPCTAPLFQLNGLGPVSVTNTAEWCLRVNEWDFGDVLPREMRTRPDSAALWRDARCCAGNRGVLYCTHVLCS